MTHEELLKLAQTGNLTEDAILQITQETRRAMLVEQLKGGVPTGKDMYRVMQLVDGMDATALNTKKLESDDAHANADREAALIISQMANQLGNTNPFKAGANGMRDVTPAAGEIPVIEPKHEENAIGVSNLTYDEFVTKTEESESD